MLRHEYTLEYMRAHNLIRVIERPVTDAVNVQRAANALAVWRQHVRRQLDARPGLAAAFSPEDRARARLLHRCFRVLRAGSQLPAIFRPEDRAHARRLLWQYRVARRMHLRLLQQRVHVLYRCFQVLCAPQKRARILTAHRALQRLRLAAQVHKRLAKHELRAMRGPFRALDALWRMALWVPRLLIVWRQWVRGCARQRRAKLLVAAAGGPLCLRRRGRSWTLPSGVGRQLPCGGCGL